MISRARKASRSARKWPIAMLALRANDGRAAPAPVYVFGSGPGVYQATMPFPPNGQPVNTHARALHRWC